jgi:hypothetical protein
MQYWIFFEPGVGGDGFANLLEHADNVVSADGEQDWRIHHNNGAVKFYGAKWTTDPIPFRQLNVDTASATLNPHYCDLIDQKQNTILCAHPNAYRSQIAQSPFKDLVQTDQIKIHLYSLDFDRVAADLVAKIPGVEINADWHSAMQKKVRGELARTDYAIHIDIEKVWTDWGYLVKCLTALGINLDQTHYEDYLNIISRKHNELKS